jgi:hypothetical protein
MLPDLLRRFLQMAKNKPAVDNTLVRRVLAQIQTHPSDFVGVGRSVIVGVMMRMAQLHQKLKSRQFREDDRLQKDMKTFEVLEIALVHQVSSLDKRQLTGVLWALNTLRRQENRELLIGLLKRLPEVAREIETYRLSMALVAIAKLTRGLSSRDRIEAAQAVIARAGEVAVDLKPHRIATILTELAVLNEPLSSTPSQPLLQHAATVAVTFEPRAAATTLRALAKLGWVHSGANEGKGVSRGVDAAQTLYENLIENLQVSVLNGAEASAVAWASGKTRVRMTPAMSAELAKRAVETCEEMSAREASSALWGLTVVGIRSHTALFNRMSRDIRMGGFTNVQALSNFLWVCASSSLCPCRHASQSLFAETYLRAGDARASRGPRCGSDPCSAGTIGGDEKTARFGGCLELPMVCKCSEP